MNEDNKINTQTKLYGFIAVEAQQNRFATTLNRLYKESGSDAMMIPMNIREDDFYFTLSNMKNSQVNGAVLGVEFQKEILDLLDVKSNLVTQCGYCDVVRVIDKQLYGDVVGVNALVQSLKDVGAQKVAVIGSGALACSLYLQGDSFEFSFFHEHIEGVLEMSERLSTELDINRCAVGMDVDLSGFDAVVDASTARSLEMISALAQHNFDLKADSVPSPLRQRAIELNAEYRGYDSLLKVLTQTTKEFLEG
ncbi:MAG TPA: hypothetical protein ENK65_02920 [Helicobacteraceae bacterium]|nr:hypothetical protein [Helicobacteraceae bacterium]